MCLFSTKCNFKIRGFKAEEEQEETFDGLKLVQSGVSF